MNRFLMYIDEQGNKWAISVFEANRVVTSLEVQPWRPAVWGIKYSEQDSMAVGEDHIADRDAHDNKEWADQIKYENDNMEIL